MWHERLKLWMLNCVVRLKCISLSYLNWQAATRLNYRTALHQFRGKASRRGGDAWKWLGGVSTPYPPWRKWWFDSLMSSEPTGFLLKCFRVSGSPLGNNRMVGVDFSIQSHIVLLSMLCFCERLTDLHLRSKQHFVCLFVSINLSEAWCLALNVWKNSLLIFIRIKGM